MQRSTDKATKSVDFMKSNIIQHDPSAEVIRTINNENSPEPQMNVPQPMSQQPIIVPVIVNSNQGNYNQQ